MKNVSESAFLLLHGWPNRRPAGHWQHWLAGELVARGAQVLYPQLPEPDSPSLDDWLRDVRRYVAAMRGEEKVIVAHSLAVLLWWSAALSEEPIVVDRVLLVAAPAPEFLRQLQPVAAFVPTDMETRGLPPNTRRTMRLVASDDDPYCPGGAATVYAGTYGIDIDVVEGAGHLDLAAGYGPWPTALEWCLDPSVRIAAR